MVKKLLSLVCILQVALSMGQECPILSIPRSGDSDVPVTTEIRWNAIEGVPGYIISIGTTPGGTDIVNGRSVGSATGYIPPLGLPDTSQVYVTLTLFFFDRHNISCPSTSFRTVDVVDTPSCTALRNPVNGAINVNVGNNIVWNYAPTATNYRLSLGTSEGATDPASPPRGTNSGLGAIVDLGAALLSPAIGLPAWVEGRRICPVA
jgi:hypothetical protein